MALNIQYFSYYLCDTSSFAVAEEINFRTWQAARPLQIVRSAAPRLTTAAGRTAADPPLHTDMEMTKFTRRLVSTTMIIDATEESFRKSSL